MTVTVINNSRFNRKYSITSCKNINTGVCNLYLKLESFNLGGSVKDRPAKNMIETAEKLKLLKKGGDYCRSYCR